MLIDCIIILDILAFKFIFHHDKSYTYGSGWVCYITHRLERDNYFEQNCFKYSLYKCLLQEFETSDPLLVLSICSFGLDNGRSVLKRNLSNVCCCYFPFLHTTQTLQFIYTRHYTHYIGICLIWIYIYTSVYIRLKIKPNSVRIRF